MKKLLLTLLSILSMTYVSLFVIALFFSDALIFLPQPVSYQQTDDLIEVTSVDAADVSRSHTIVAYHMVNPAAKYTILYSHGNAVDIGQLVSLQRRFYAQGYSIITYDYSGYGLSEAAATEQQVYNDVQAVYRYLIDDAGVKAEQIIAYGHSVGAAVATELAYRRPVAGLVLESPFVSAFRVKTVYPLMPFDKFNNIKKIGDIKAPVLIMHSRDDPVIPFWHGQALYEKANMPKSSLWLEHSGHGGITYDDRFWSAFKEFTSMLSM